ncbi:MAG: hypothetical protein KDI36_09435 [Pseudomonadales bacterium]|nr:hypothetical protein [Pseudomonadales bacterium]
MAYTAADAIAEALAQLGTEHVFGIVSIHNMPIFQAINRLGKTRIITVRHEQAGTHAADGYARATGKPGVMIASTGPGTSNTVTGLYEALYGSSPVLVITGQAETAFYGRGAGYVHEAEHQVEMLRPVCRRVESPRHVSQIGPAFNMVVAEMLTGRKGPVAIEIPIDLQYAAAEPFSLNLPQESRASADEAVASRVAKAVGQASRRIIVAGGGVIAAGASDKLEKLARLLDAPVLTTVDGRGVMNEDDPLCVGNFFTSAGIYQAIESADLTLAFGTRFAVGNGGVGQKMRPPGKLVQVDIDGAMIGRTHSVDIPWLEDAGVALDALLAELEKTEQGGLTPNDAQFNETVSEARDGVRSSMRARLGKDFQQIMDRLRAHLPADGICVRDQTISAYNWGNMLFPVYSPRTSLNPTSGAIGPGLPMALGAAVGSGKKTVVIHGDGGFMFHATEMATLAQYKIPLVICLFNDSGYGVLRWLQENEFGDFSDTDLGKVAFVKMAESMGVPGRRVRDIASYDQALAEAFATDGPFIVEIDMEYFEPMAISKPPHQKLEVDVKQ